MHDRTARAIAAQTDIRRKSAIRSRMAIHTVNFQEFPMLWRKLIGLLPAILIAGPIALFMGVVLWSSFQPPCLRTELRSVIATEGKYTRGGPRYYHVCVER